MFIFRNSKKSFLFIFCCLAVIIGAVLLLRQPNSPVYSPVYEVNTSEKAVALCVNVDWGEEYLGDMLRILKAEDAKATFFVTGRWVDAHPEAATKIKKAGMEIGNHGLKHKSPNAMSYEENIEDIRAAENLINRHLHIKTVLFAPAAGECEPQVQKAAEACGYRMILWSVDTIDWQKPEKELICQRVSQKVKPGAIVLMHPTENTVLALPEILKDLKAKKLQTVFVSELLHCGE